jgi:hypothetical protein
MLLALALFMPMRIDKLPLSGFRYSPKVVDYSQERILTRASAEALPSIASRDDGRFSCWEPFVRCS